MIRRSSAPFATSALRGASSTSGIVSRVLKDDENDDGDKPKITTFVPSKSPTQSPLALAGSSDGQWYDSDAFIVSAVLVGVFLLVGAALKFWWMKKALKSHNVDDHSHSFNGLGGGGKRYLGDPSLDKGPYTESESLLGARAVGSSISNNNSNSGASHLAPPTLAGANAKKAVAPFSIGADTPKFSPDDLNAAEEATLMKKFTMIMAGGVVISLHTTKGPKPVLLSLVGDEVRWQAVKTAQKRYKLNLRDVTYVTQGKTTSNFGRASCADDRLCFSLLTNKTTLDLEASSTLERDCLCKGFKVAVEKSKGIST